MAYQSPTDMLGELLRQRAEDAARGIGGAVEQWQKAAKKTGDIASETAWGGATTPGQVTVERDLAQVPGAMYERGYARMQAEDAQRRAAAQAGYSNIDQSQQEQFRQGQQALAGLLMQGAMGQGPSVAEQQLKRGLDSSLAQQFALAQSQPGMSAAGALRGAQTAQAGLAQGAIGQAAEARAQEALAQRGMLGQLLGGARGQDIGLATEQAGLNQGVNLANLGASQNQQAMNDAMQRFWEQQSMGWQGMQSGQNMELMKLLAQIQAGNVGMQYGATEAEKQRRYGMVPSFGQVAGTAGNVAAGGAQGLAALLPLLGLGAAAV